MFASCSKEGTDMGTLEGKWWVAEKAEFYFNGSAVSTEPKFVFIYNNAINKIKFEKGTATIVLDNGYTLTASYSTSGKSLVLDYISYTVRSSSKNSIVFEQLPYEESVAIVGKEDVSTGDVFNGKEIFYAATGAPYYYVSDSGKAIPCCPSSNEEYWYDTQVSYFSAE